MDHVPSFADPHSFYAFLRAAIEDGGTASLAKIGELAAVERELEIKGPCVAALACWGDAGFSVMVQNALRNTTSKDTSAAIKTLALIAARKPLSSTAAFIIDQATVDLINGRLAQTNLADTARQRLAELVMSLRSEDLLIPLGVSFTQVSFADSDAAGEIVAAISAKWLGFGPRELDQCEQILEQSPEDEPALHSFFEQYPQVIDPLAVEVWSKPDFHGFKEPDFLIRRSDNSYIVVEIENAAKPIMTQSNQPTSYVTQAVKQANDYRAFLRERLAEAKKHFPRLDDPDSLVVIGMERTLSGPQKEALRQENYSRNKLRIVGFDELLIRSRAIISNVIASKVRVVKRYRVV
ncbi:Shedu anti-phage system protein SduA domain-containing protein [Bradyrhizobium oligotrophicum]|uniref:Shedu anti-phage system protein SduA domain-containing protein n=1 Tax=Bradyrhizobium oligotrophicum TaxID=44255 RepID=UPI003EBC33A1